MAVPSTAYQAPVGQAPQTKARRKLAKHKPPPAASPRLASTHTAEPGLETGVLPEQIVDGPQSGRVAIFSLFDPVIQPDNYGSWLRRVPRSKEGPPTWPTPYFAKRQV